MQMTNLDKLLKDFKDARSAATQGTWENQGDIYIWAKETMVADNNDDDAVLRARGVGGGMSLEQQVANLNLCVLAANKSDKLIKIIEVLRERLENIKEIQEHLGGESVLLDDVNEALQQAEKIAGE